MSMKHRRGNREAKKPKQNKPKVIVSASPFASASSNPAKGAAAKHKESGASNLAQGDEAQDDYNRVRAAVLA